MNDEAETPQAKLPADERSEYVAPRIETVITSEDLEREVHYAGTVDGTGLVQP